MDTPPRQATAITFKNPTRCKFNGFSRLFSQGWVFVINQGILEVGEWAQHGMGGSDQMWVGFSSRVFFITSIYLTGVPGLVAPHEFHVAVCDVKDVLIWDSSITEGDQGYQDIMHRQSLLDGLKVPILWMEAVGAAKFLHTRIPVGCPGSGSSGIKGQNNLTKVENEIPFAVHTDCSSEIKDVCKSHEYDSECWIDRPDVTPTKEQESRMAPRNKHHHLKRRVLAFTFLEALRHTLIQWKGLKDFEN